MRNKTESALALAAVVASLGTALGVAPGDVQAATENGGTSPASNFVKLPGGGGGPSANYGKIESNQIKWTAPANPGASQLKLTTTPPGATQIKWDGKPAQQ